MAKDNTARAEVVCAENSILEKEAVIRELRRHVQSSEQEREQAMELWQMASRELEHLREVYQKSLSGDLVQDSQVRQLEGQFAEFQANNHNLEMTNQQLLKKVAEQSLELEELQSQLRQAKDELRTAMEKVEEMTTLLQNIQTQMQREHDGGEPQGLNDEGNRQLQQLQAALGQLESRIEASSQEAENFHKEKVAWERRLGELQASCTTLEEEKYDALAKVRESIQMAEDAKLQNDQLSLIEKQKTEELTQTKEAIKQLIQEAAARTRKEVENVRKQYNAKIQRMAKDLSALQLECADKEVQLERSLRDKKSAEEKLAKVSKENLRDLDFKKMDALNERCQSEERLREEMSLSLQTTQKRLKQMDMEHSEKLSRCQEEVQRLEGSLASARDNCSKVSDERLQLQQENVQQRKEMDEMRKAILLLQRKTKQQVSQMEQEFKLREQGLDARIRELQLIRRSSTPEVTRLVDAQQKSIQTWKEVSSTVVQAFETKIVGLMGEGNRQRQRLHELEKQRESDRNIISEYERKLAEQQEKFRQLQRQLAQSEQRATTAAQQLDMLVSRRKHGFS